MIKTLSDYNLLESEEWKYHLSITTTETPSYTPKNKKSSSPIGEKPSKFIDKD